MAITDPQAQFYTGLARAVQHWLAFWQTNGHDPAALRRTRGHALRVLMWCAECDCHLDIAADLASAMHTHMIRTAEWHEWEACLRQVLLRANASLGEDRVCRVRFYLSELCMRMQRHDEALALAQENYRRGVCAGNLSQQLDATLVTAEVYLNAENYGPAREYAERGTALAIAAGNIVREADGLINVARALIGQRAFTEAERRLQRALALTEAAGSIMYQAKTHNFLGLAASVQGDWPAALCHYRQAFPLVEAYGDAVGRGVVLGNIGRVLLELGQWDAAGQALEEALRIHHTHGNTPAEQVCQRRLAELSARRASTT